MFCSMWNVCVRERVAVVAVRMPLEVCPGIRKTEQRRGQRMPNHFETSMQNTQLAEPTQPSFVEKTGPSTLPSRMPHMPRHLLNTILIPYTHSFTHMSLTLSFILLGLLIYNQYFGLRISKKNSGFL